MTREAEHDGRPLVCVDSVGRHDALHYRGLTNAADVDGGLEAGFDRCCVVQNADRGL